MAPPWKKEQQTKRKAKEQAKAAQQAEQQRQAQAKVAVAASSPWPAALPEYNGKGDYRFVNPYNFVCYLPAPTGEPTTLAAQLTWRCPPPPHDRYMGLSGAIRCELEVVTPLFVADSEQVQIKPYRDDEGALREHLSYRFFQVDGQDALPATSLRGAIRALFEAVTNSCFAVFDRERQLDYRAEPKYGNTLKKNGGIVTKLATPESDGELRLCHTGTVGFYYKPSDEKRNASGLDTRTWHSGDYIAARARQRDNGSWQVLEIANQISELGVCRRDEDGKLRQQHVEGWLYITGKGEDTNKKNETFILDPDKHGDRGRIAFSHAIQAEYDRIRQTQFEQDELPAPLHSPKLGEGEFVWVDLAGEGKNRILNRFSRVQVPRVPHPSALGELLPAHLHPCQEYDALCPACRVFGWVKDAHQAGARHWDREAQTAYAGRVRFSHATLVDGKHAGCYAEELPLAILSSPKPTTSLFYLYKGDPNEAAFEVPEGDREIQYKAGYKLRGRKFYHHHGKLLNRQEFERAGNADHKQDLQNRSVRGVRRPGNGFAFTIQFENLAEVELGALLWTLKLGENEGCHLRLGYGKPLGFGSVKVNQVELTTINWATRYQSSWLTQSSVSAQANRDASRKLQEDCLAAFDGAMKAAYGRSVFDLPHMQDLYAILKEPDPQWPSRIHYPRAPRPQHNHAPDPEGKNFEWFVGNKSGGQGKGTKKGPFHALPSATQMGDGLPLIDKDSVEAGLI